MDIVAVFRGLVLNPLLVSFARGTAEAAAMAAILVGYEALASKDLPAEIQPFAFLGVLGLRMVEGFADKIDPAKQRRRDALREEGKVSEVTAGANSALNPGDVKDPEVDAAIEAYNAGDYT